MIGKRIRWAAGLLILGTVFCMGGTAAYFLDQDQILNIAEVGYNTSHIVEEFPQVPPKPITDNPSYRKVVQVENTNAPCYVRVSLSYSNSDVAEGIRFMDLNMKDWIYHERDGYYYYRHRLGPGEKTLPLFSGFQIDSSKIPEKWRPYISDFSIIVYEESIQAGSYTEYEPAWEHYLTPAYI